MHKLKAQNGPQILLSDRRAGNQRGAILPLMAIMVVVLLGSAAMAVDLGWLYWNSIEIQHAADAAALSGVVYEPGDRTQAHVEGKAAAAENGFDDAAAQTTVQIIDVVDDPTLVDNDSQLRATITHSVDTFFLGLFALDTVDVSRTAVAQYALPLSLGSPDSYLGTDPELGLTPGFWLSTTGTYGHAQRGARYTDLCKSGTNNPSCTQHNMGPRPPVDWGEQTASGGSIFIISVPVGASALKLEIFDGPHYGDDSDDKMTGDDHSDLADTWFMLYGPDNTPLDTTDNELLCSVRYDGRENGGREDDIAGWNNSWDDFSEVSPQSLISQLWDDMANTTLGVEVPPPGFGSCKSFDQGPGIYPLRVMVEHNTDDYTQSHFSMRTTTTGPAASISGLGDIQIFVNEPSGGGLDMYLAEVGEQYAGRDMVIELWDGGDMGGTGTMTILDGTDNPPADCTWVGTDMDWNVIKTGSGCVIPHDDDLDDAMNTITVPIPNDYTCTGLGCWFKVEYDYSGESYDATTWTVYIPGDPLQLVE